MIRIGIDARLCGRKNAGIGRYIENLLLRLPLLPTSSTTTWIYFLSEKNQLSDLMAAIGGLQLPPHITASNFFQNIEIVYAPIRHYSWAEQTEWPRLLKSQKLDLLHVPHFNVPLLYRGQMMVTIHDLLWHEKKGLDVTTLKPSEYYFKYFFYRLVTWAAVEKALRIFVPAQTVAQTVAHYYPRVKKKLVVTPEGFYQTQPQPLALNIQKKIPTNKPFLLYVGSLYPHKNIQVVLQTLRTQPSWDLVIVGSRNVFLDRIKYQVRDTGLTDKVHFLGFVPDGQLTTLYTQALALIQPSLSEGFGLTGLEAMNLGTPVLASDIPIFHEVYGQAVLYFDPYQPKSLLNVVAELTPSKVSQLAQMGKKQAQLYDWQKMVVQTAHEYQKALKK